MDIYDLQDRENDRINSYPMMGSLLFEEYIWENIKEWKYLTSAPVYVSTMRFDNDFGFIETIYGIHLYHIYKADMYMKIQKVAVIAEALDQMLYRNLWKGWGMSAGVHSYGYTGRDGKWYGYMKEFDVDRNNEFRNISRTQLFENEDLVAMDPSLKYLNYRPMDIHAIDYIRLYRKHPQVCEMMMKLGLTRMINEKALCEIERNPNLAKYLARNRENLHGVAFQTAKNAWRKNPTGDPLEYCRSLKAKMENGRGIAFTDKSLWAKTLRHTSRERIRAYLDEKGLSHFTYEDYLKSASFLKLDFSDTRVLFPKNFREMHDLYTKQYYRHQNRELIEKMQRTADRFSYLADYRGDGYCVFIARSKDELIDEGSALNHCVGRMDYDKRQADGRSVICFIRRESEPDKPFVTAEVKINESGLKVVQCYGYRDSTVPEVQGFVESWMKESNKRRSA